MQKKSEFDTVEHGVCTEFFLVESLGGILAGFYFQFV